jgi:hypothetical protein
MSKKVFDEVKGFKQYPCVTIVLPTHRTSPDNKQDAIVLKNLITEVHNRLAEEFSKRDLTKFQKNLERIEEIDLNHSKEGLVVFINEDIFTYDRLLFKPEARVVIDDTFATRDLIRAAHKAENYYIMTLGRDKVKLYEGFLENVTEYHGGGFPFENNTLYLSQASERAAGSKEDQMIEEFFNRVDKAFLDIFKENPGDLILAGVDRNASHYRSIADKKDVIIGTIGLDGENEKAHDIAKAAWPLMRETLEKRQKDALSVLEKAVSDNKFESDLNLIWKAVHEGRGDTLYAEQGYFQAAIISDAGLQLTDDVKAPGVNDDIVDEIAELTLQYGGKVVFLPDGALEKYGKIAIVTRF